MEDKRRKTRVNVRKVPAPVEWILKNATGEQLEYLDRLAKADNFNTFVNLISKFKHYNVYEVFNFQARDDKELAVFRAAKVGEVAGLDALIYASQLSSEEIKRRRALKVKV